MRTMLTGRGAALGDLESARRWLVRPAGGRRRTGSGRSGSAWAAVSRCCWPTPGCTRSARRSTTPRSTCAGVPGRRELRRSGHEGARRGEQARVEARRPGRAERRQGLSRRGALVLHRDPRPDGARSRSGRRSTPSTTRPARRTRTRGSWRSSGNISRPSRPPVTTPCARSSTRPPTPSPMPPTRPPPSSAPPGPAARAYVPTCGSVATPRWSTSRPLSAASTRRPTRSRRRWRGCSPARS